MGAGACGTVFLTGATGLVGGAVLRRLLVAEPGLRARVLVRDPGRWPPVAARLGRLVGRVEPVRGDLRLPGLGLPAPVRRRLAEEVTAVVHAAADVVFSRSLEDARATNVEGTRHLLELAAGWPRAERFAFVSTAYVSGRRVGRVPERPLDGEAGWVNAYERSKWEAEAVVREEAADWVVFRPSSIVFDLARGAVAQFNAVHEAIRLLHHGLVPMLPGAPGTAVDLVPSDYVADAVARLALRPSVSRCTFHLCAGQGAMPLDELLESAWRIWSADPEWRRRAIPRPPLADPETYALFERSVEQTADESLRRATRSLAHFAPHLGLPKRFETGGTDAALGRSAPAVASYWPRLLTYLESIRWTFETIRAAG